MRLVALTAGIALAVSPSMAQVKNGDYIATVSVTNVGGQMYMVNPATRKVTRMKIRDTSNTDPFVADSCNCIYLFAPNIAYVGTVGNPANLFRLTIAGTSAIATKINKTPFPGSNLSQIVRVGGTLYCASQKGTGTGALSRIPLAGGTPTMLVDFSTVSGFTGLVNAMAGDGAKKLWLGVWTNGDIFEYDIASKKVTLLVTLPRSKRLSSGTSSYPVNMHYRAGKIYCVGLYGDFWVVDPATKKVVQHLWERSVRPSGMSEFKNSMAFNSGTGDWMYGSRDGALETFVPIGTGQIARREIGAVGSSATLTQNSVNGLAYRSDGGDYAAQGAGCKGSGGWLPTSVGRGAGRAGNGSFAFGLHGAKAAPGIAVLIIGVTNKGLFPIDLTAAGAPGCFLRNDPSLMFGATLSGTANGIGAASLPVPLPNATLTLFTQWMVLDSANSLGLVFSDGRRLKT